MNTYIRYDIKTGNEKKLSESEAISLVSSSINLSVKESQEILKTSSMEHPLIVNYYEIWKSN